MSDKTPLKTVESASGSGVGYIAEWRATQSLIVPDEMGTRVPTTKWQKMPYLIRDMLPETSGNNLIRPVIADFDGTSWAHGLSNFGLVRLEVAEALIACMKTQVIAQLSFLKDITEYRITECDYKHSYEVTKPDEEGGET